MPTQGVFARVIREGTVRPGDKMEVIMPDPDRPFSAAVIVLSDKGAAGKRKDESGPAAKEMLEQAGYQVEEVLLLPDEPEVLKQQLIRLADGRQLDLVVTSGGTGFSMRDQTPEATMAVAGRNAPGIAEYIRYRSMELTSRAMLGRGVSSDKVLPVRQAPPLSALISMPMHHHLRLPVAVVLAEYCQARRPDRDAV